MLLAAAENKGQERFIWGSISNSGKQPLQGVSVILKMDDSSKIIAFAVSGKDGHFRIGPLANSIENFVLEFRHIGYSQKKVYSNDLKNTGQEVLQIELAEKPAELKEIVIRRELPVFIRSDTVVFNANSYREADVRKVEDLLKKMQGFSVDPSGKLSFNGKPVEKVLIDGEDLAADGYQMITKNLNAITIDKVEVINNFSDNRLLRKVTNTGKVGVNLKISSRFKSKLSGSAEGGLSWEGRYNADMNAIHITQGSKWLVFGNYNNIARDVSGNAKYYYTQEGGQLSSENRPPVGAAVLEEGSFVMPAVGDRYTRDNRDLGIAVMSSWKMGKYTRLNGMIGYDDLRQKNYASNSVLTHISDQEKWSVFSNMDLNRTGRDLVGRLSLQRDAGKKQVSRLEMVVNAGSQENLFLNSSTGDITDSLKEKLSNKLKGLRLKGQQTWLMGEQVVQLELILDHGSMDQDLAVGSSRFLSYWNLDSTYTLNRQILAKLNDLRHLQLKVNGKTARLQYEYGILLEHSGSEFRSQAKISSVVFKPPFEPVSQIIKVLNNSARGAFRLLFNAGKAGWFGINGNTGMQSIDADRGKNWLLVYETGVGYTKKFGLMNSFQLSYKNSRGFRRFDQMYPDHLMSGNATVLNGLKFSEPEVSHGWVAAIQGNNIGKQRNWSANLSYLFLPQRYISGVDVFPQYCQQYFQLSHYSRVFNLGLNGEIYVRELKSKLGSLISVYAGKDENIVNGVQGRSARRNLKIESWWISGFRIPANMELRFGSNYSEGNWNGGPLNSVWQFYWSNKVKLRFGESLYGSFMWNGQKILNQKAFHGLDVYVIYKLSPAVQISANGVNLLNIRRIVDAAVMPYSSSENVFMVVGRYILASVSFTF
jgi:hypothetical protein